MCMDELVLWQAFSIKKPVLDLLKGKKHDRTLRLSVVNQITTERDWWNYTNIIVKSYFQKQHKKDLKLSKLHVGKHPGAQNHVYDHVAMESWSFSGEGL